MSYKKCIARGISSQYYGESVEVHSDNYAINEAYIDDKGRLIVEFEWLSDLQEWNRRTRKSVQIAYAWSKRIRWTDQCDFEEGNYKHPLYANDFDLKLRRNDCHLYDTDDYALCSDCGEICEKDNMTTVEDEYVCDDCLNNGDYFYCNNCNEWHKGESVTIHTSTWSGSDRPYEVCERCAEDVAYCCNHCGDWYEKDIMYRGADDEMYCEDCWNDKFEYCTACGDVIWRDDAYHDDDGNPYCSCCWDEREEEGGVRSYHNNPRLCKHYWGNEERTEKFIGTEIETEGGDKDERIEITREYGDDEECIYQMHDGSLDDSGIECITQPMSKAYWDHFDFEEWMSKLRGAGAISHDSKNCGLHVHLSRTWMNTDDEDMQSIYVARMRQFISDNQEWVEKYSRRSANHWCAYSKTFDKSNKPSDKKEREEEHKKKGKQGDRYQSVNNQNRATIEFRIFRGTLIPNTYRAAVEFCLRLVDYIITHDEGQETLYDFLHYKPLPESMSTYMAQRHINF